MRAAPHSSINPLLHRRWIRRWTVAFALILLMPCAVLAEAAAAAADLVQTVAPAHTPAHTEAPADTSRTVESDNKHVVQRLIIDQRIEQTHDASARFEYIYQSADDSLLVVEVEQLGLDLILAYTDPAGATQAVNSPLQRDEREVLVIGGSPGLHSIRIYSEEYTDAGGGHSIVAFHPETPPGARPIRPYALMMRGNQLNFENHSEQRQVAVDSYRLAAAAWAAAEQPAETAWALMSGAGILYWSMSDWESAAGLARQAAALYAGAGDQALFAAATHLEAAALMELAGPLDSSPAGPSLPKKVRHLENAGSLLDIALLTQQRLGLAYPAAKTINNMGLLAYYRDDWDLAEERWKASSQQFNTLHEWRDEQLSLSNLGVLLLQRGKLVDAVDTFTRTLEVLPAADENWLAADTLDNRARARIALGNYDAALQDYFSASRIHTTLNNLKGQGRSLSGIATAYQSLGEFASAKDHYLQSLVLREASNDIRGTISTLIQLGNVCRELQEMDCALAAHARADKIAVNDYDRARALTALAADYLETGEPARALPFLESAIANARRHGARLVWAEGLLGLGRTRLALGEFAPARDSLIQAQALFTDMGITEQTGETMYLLAKTFAEQGDWPEAIRLTDQAIARIEQVRDRLTTPALRSSYLAHSLAAYELQIELLMSLAADATGDDALALARKAFDTAERSRGRMMLDLINEASLDIDADVATENVARRQALMDAMTELAYQRDTLLQKSGDESGAYSDRLAAVVSQLDTVASEIRVLDIDIRSSSPRYAALAAPRVLDSREVQQSLPDDAALLMFYVGEARGFLWILTHTELRWRALPGRPVLDEQARAAAILLQSYPADHTARQQRDALLGQLARDLLGDDFQVPGKDRLIVSPDGALHYLPFAALPLPDRDGRARFLLSDYEITRVSSASAMVAGSLTEPRADATMGIAVFADPIMARNDPRQTSGIEPGPGRQAWLTDLDRLQRLEWSAEEAASIAALTEPGTSLVITGPSATRDAVLSADLRRYRFVHFATHSFVDTEYPALSGLVLSRTGAAGPGEGLLQVDQISRLSMNADLVVLSACETALGREIRGEGLVGLVQGFFLAGARQVVASLWRVPDRATAELMELFYRKQILDHQPPAAALRAAQIELAQARRWADPYYWASFVVQGVGPGD